MYKNKTIWERNCVLPRSFCVSELYRYILQVFLTILPVPTMYRHTWEILRVRFQTTSIRQISQLREPHIFGVAVSFPSAYKVMLLQSAKPGPPAAGVGERKPISRPSQLHSPGQRRGSFGVGGGDFLHLEVHLHPHKEQYM